MSIPRFAELEGSEITFTAESGESQSAVVVSAWQESNNPKDRFKFKMEVLGAFMPSKSLFVEWNDERFGCYSEKTQTGRGATKSIIAALIPDDSFFR